MEGQNPSDVKQKKEKKKKKIRGRKHHFSSVANTIARNSRIILMVFITASYEYYENE